MADASTELRPPSPWLLLAEAGRAPWEYAATMAAMPWLNNVPAGDGHAVIVFPGLGASELSTRTLRDYLTRLGYATYDWGLGRNRPLPGVMEACRERVLEVAYDHMEGTRFRHTAQFRRWRDDRDPSSCTYDQLEEPVRYDLTDILPGAPGVV